MAHAVWLPALLTAFSLVSRCAAGRGEATSESISMAGAELGLSSSASALLHVLHTSCENAAESTKSAPETIKALEECISLLQRYSKDSNSASERSKRAGQQYSSNVNALGSFLKSLQSKVKDTLLKQQQRYDKLRRDQKQAFSGLMKQLDTLPTAARSAQVGESSDSDDDDDASDSDRRQSTQQRKHNQGLHKDSLMQQRREHVKQRKALKASSALFQKLRQQMKHYKGVAKHNRKQRHGHEGSHHHKQVGDSSDSDDDDETGDRDSRHSTQQHNHHRRSHKALADEEDDE
eukprot:TRINITY_DN2981_c0_g1_i1.p1 TRINITY_DN2981_c0_g1~~TRINITY_DN2981_c0_g1_i1.p1  ORF type:complete len:291 (+),score=70.96 TRINITY_DN2981_c0_g1_i1:128-1000(+)